MNMASNNHLKAYQKNAAPQQGYANNAPQPGSPTYTEAWALIESARRMAVTVQDGITDDPEHRRTIREALRLNWRLWTIFQAELTTAETSPVPEDIRINMLTLCRFVDQHTIETMAEPTPDRLITLIDMNRNIASGLLDSLKTNEENVEDGVVEQATPQASSPQETSSEPPSPPSGLSGIDHEI